LALILLIDDDDQIRTMLREMLGRAGYMVMEASDGKEGVKLYRDQPCDLIITDIIMPEKEGIETIRELKRDFPDVKIIAMSGGGRIDAEDYLHMAKMLGAQRTFAKPIERDKLLGAIKELLK
jgi:CheY-like chemotaxis protein